MLRVCTSVCLAAGMTTTAAVFAEPQTVPVSGGGNRSIRDVTVSGCVAPASQPNEYVINVIDERNASTTQPAAGAIAPGTPLRLVGLPPDDFQDYVGQQVEVFGMLVLHGSSHGRGGSSGADAKTRVGVRYIRQLAATCSAPAPAAVTAARGKNTDIGFDRGSKNSGRSRNAAAAAPAAVPPASTPAGATTPGTTATPGSQPVSNNTATSPGSVGTAPSNSTTANAGLGQSGISGSATLSGSFAMTPPVMTFPLGPPAPVAPGSTQSPLTGGTRPSVPGSTQPPVPGSTQSPVPGSTQPPVPGSTQPPVPGATPSTVPASTLPGTSTPLAGFAQGASNTTTSNAALDQFGLSGDALLSGLVNVNVQQLLASVQVMANLNVQDVIVNLSDILNDNQIQLLVQALNTNPQAALNANDLTSALQGSGVLDPSEWVVGVTGSQIYANKSLTDALQSRGIIQPTETIMTTANPHVFVVGPGGGGQ
jgi:hypothetical protein